MNPTKIGFITGASKGIGRFLAETLCNEGHKIFGCSRSAASWDHPNFVSFQGDVSNETDVRAMMQKIRKHAGCLDFIINNAGIASMNHSLLVPTETAHRIFNTNFHGTFLVSREGARLLQKSTFGGRIINFSTVAVALDLEGESIYAASKAAVETLTRTMAKELSTMKITVNAVGPTPIETDLIRAVPPDKIQALLRRQAINRLGKFEDVKNVIDFFLKPESNFVTGQIIYLGGVVA